MTTKPMQTKQYYVYILTNISHTLYIGMTSNLEQRLYQHKHKLAKGFTEKYNLSTLIYFEIFDDPYQAITREKELKGKTRQKKLEIIKSQNPEFTDLSEKLFV